MSNQPQFLGLARLVTLYADGGIMQEDFEQTHPDGHREADVYLGMADKVFLSKVNGENVLSVSTLVRDRFTGKFRTHRHVQTA